MTAFRSQIEERFRELRDRIVSGLEDLEGGGARFRRTSWARPGGGGGEMSELRAELFEKAGCNFSAVHGDRFPAAPPDLSLSSHGSEDGSISISNDGRSPADLSAIDLAAMLREAKIPWKVVVVSACYSGAFIDALRDEHTIVLTAAAADRTSFGCGDDRDLTYFGEAFYQDAIPGAPTLRAAFEQAREEIAAWEKKEQFVASDPQAFFGAAMEKKLAGMEPKE